MAGRNRPRWALSADAAEGVARLRESLAVTVDALQASHADCSERWRESERGEAIGTWIEEWAAVVALLDETADTATDTYTGP